MKRVLLQPAYVLHRRPYRETSFLIELITPEYGRISAVAKGVRKPRSASPGLLQPFVPLVISWSGKHELMTLTDVEANGVIKNLNGECLFAGLYLNELLMCLLQKWDAHPNLYKAYEQTLAALQLNQLDEKVLRSFEKYLLEELGYGFLPKSIVSLQNNFLPDKFYCFTTENGFVESDHHSASAFSGKSLIDIATENWRDAQCLADAKRLIRLILAPLLGARPLHSRRLFLKDTKHE